MHFSGEVKWGVSSLVLDMSPSSDTTTHHPLTGNSVIDWLIYNEKVRNRQEGLMLATGLLTEGFLQAAGDISKEGAEGTAESALLDQSDAFYYFVSTSVYCGGNV